MRRVIALLSALGLAACAAKGIPQAGPLQPMEFAIRGSLFERCQEGMLPNDYPCLLFIYHDPTDTITVVQQVRGRNQRGVHVARTVYQVDKDQLRQRLPADGGFTKAIRLDGLRGFMYTLPEGGGQVMMKLTDIRGCRDGDVRRVGEDDPQLFDGLCKLRLYLSQDDQVDSKLK
jgi:hypothetical protein